MERDYPDYLRTVIESLNKNVGTDIFKTDFSPGLSSLLVLVGGRPVANIPNVAHGDNNVSGPELKRFISNAFIRKLKPSDFSDLSAISEKLLIAGAKSKGIDITPEEAQEILHILETGEFFGDVSSATAAIVHTIPGLPLAILSDMKRPPLPDLTLAILEDLNIVLRPITSLRLIRTILNDLEDGRFDHPPHPMVNTMRVLYRVATVREALQTIHELYSPKNRSVRLATIIYARSNGIDLTEADIDLVLTTVLDPDNPDLAPAIADAYNKFASNNKGRDFVRLLKPA
jgi:hypothetical protein